jgi:hypothetical protein
MFDHIVSARSEQASGHAAAAFNVLNQVNYGFHRTIPQVTNGPNNMRAMVFNRFDPNQPG